MGERDFEHETDSRFPEAGSEVCVSEREKELARALLRMPHMADAVDPRILGTPRIYK